MPEYRRIPMGPLSSTHPPTPNSSPVHPSLVRRNTDGELNKSSEKYVVYPQRWLILATCCVLALSNSMQWMSYSTLTEQTIAFYCKDSKKDCEAGFWTNQIFQGVAVLTGLGGMYITDHYGIRLSINCGVGLNVFGSLVRLCSTIPLIQSPVVRQILLHSGSVIVAAAQAFFLVLPSKIAECWFPENQRALANVLSFIANPFGVVLGTMIPTWMFKGITVDKDSWMFCIFNSIMSGMACCNLVMALCITRSLPKTPPSPSNAAHTLHSLGFWESIKACLLEKQFVVQLFTFGLAFSQLWGVMMFLPDILLAQGYNITGQAPAICAFVGVLASLLAGFICDRLKCFKEIIKSCSAVFAGTAILLRVYLIHRYNGAFDLVMVLILCSCLGAASIPQFPIGVEMGVETTFPVFEATSSGLLVLSGQLCMFGLSELFNFARKTDWIYNFPSDSTVKNWQFALDIWCVISVGAAVAAIFLLNPYYKRVAFEQQSAEETEAQNGFTRREIIREKDSEVIERM